MYGPSRGISLPASVSFVCEVGVQLLASCFCSGDSMSSQTRKSFINCAEWWNRWLIFTLFTDTRYFRGVVDTPLSLGDKISIPDEGKSWTTQEEVSKDQLCDHVSQTRVGHFLAARSSSLIPEASCKEWAGQAPVTGGTVVPWEGGETTLAEDILWARQQAFTCILQSSPHSQKQNLDWDHLGNNIPFCPDSWPNTEIKIPAMLTSKAVWKLQRKSCENIL